MLQQDPPDHTRLRGLVVKAFTARRVEDMRPRIQQIVDETLDRIIPQGKMDLIEDFAFRLPVTIICDMLGIPDEHREMFYTRRARQRSHPRAGAVDAGGDQAGQRRQAMAAMYFEQLFDLRRKNPGDDLTTQLVQAEEDGSKLTNEELDRQHHPAVRRGPRDHRQPDRQRPAGAVSAIPTSSRCSRPSRN